MKYSSRTLAGMVASSFGLFGIAHAATVGAFTGADPGEGLDLQGNFTYAANIGTPGAIGQVGDANFSADNVAGITVTAQNEIGGWTTMNFGPGDNDQRLGLVLNSIRWSASPNVVTLRLKVERNVDYKLQLLFAEQCCPGRGFNVVIDGKTEVTNFIPARIQAGEGEFVELRTQVGAVVTHSFKASSEDLVIVLDGAAADDPEISDRNAIFNGFTLERLTPTTDNDNDGLRDDWETKFFGGLSAVASGDPDEDGLTNLEEQTLNLDPTHRDTDRDSLADGEEVKTIKSDPSKKDTDGDGLEDGYEVTTLKTSPIKVDSDGDGTNDSREVSLGTDPADPASKPLLTTIGAVTGGDPGEGLDLDGNIVYALAAGGPPEAEVKVRDASFVPVVEAELPGVTLLAGNTIPNWYQVVYGESADDVALAAATSSIRWSNAAVVDRPDVVITFESLDVGAQYKVQLIFGEQCCNRGFDVFFNGNLVVKDFNPGVVHGGINNRTQTALITGIHFTRTATLEIRLDGRNATSAFTDHNAILNAVTVERVTGPSDTDNDGMPDEWEKLYFGGLTQAGTGDSDSDGSNNAEEYSLGTDPTRADSDRDGLTDGAERTAGTKPQNPDTDADGLKDGDEVNVYKSDPLKADGDGDGLGDGPEIVTYKTDPTKPDTDGDGLLDGIEAIAGTNPTVAEPPTVFSSMSSQTFFGGDPDEGLDLRGSFLVAFNVGTPGAAGKAGDADFTADNVAGITVTAQNEIANWFAPEFGDSAADDVVEKVMQSIRWSASPARPKVEIAGILPGGTYKLQLLFAESCCGGRGFNIYADGVRVAENFLPASVQGGVNNTAAGAVFTTEFVSQRDRLVIVLDGPGATSEEVNDRNATLSGVTVEVLKPGTAPIASEIASIRADATSVTLVFESIAGRRYAVEYRNALGSGAWETIADNLTATGTTTTFLDNNAARRANPQGFYRIRSL